MPVTNYPQGLSSFGMPLIGGTGPFGVTTTGNVFFVNSVTGRDQKPDGSGQGTTTGQPFKTIGYAVAQATANNGDVIYVMPLHTETVTATSINMSVAGVTVIGLGNRNTRPRLSYNATASIITMSAANCTLRNVILVAGIDEVVTAISVTAAYCMIDGVDVTEATSKQFIQFCLTAATSTDLTIQNCVHHQSTSPAANTLWIQLIGADRCKILNNTIFITTTNSASSSVIESDTTAPVNILIANNTIVQLGGTSVVPITLVSATSGLLAYNSIASAQGTAGSAVTIASCYAIQSFACHTVNKNGIIIPTIDS